MLGFTTGTNGVTNFSVVGTAAAGMILTWYLN
jgi:hypothetical protein